MRAEERQGIAPLGRTGRLSERSLTPSTGASFLDHSPPTPPPTSLVSSFRAKGCSCRELGECAIRVVFGKEEMAMLNKEIR